MNGCEIYYLLEKMLEFIPNKEKETATFAFLTEVYECDEDMIIEIKNACVNEDNNEILKLVSEFMDENELNVSDEEDW